MQPMFGLSLFLSEANAVPVELCNATGGELTGYVASSVEIRTSLNHAALSPFTPASGTWSEQGNGIYQLVFPASQFPTDNAAFNYRVETVPTGVNPAFNGFGRIAHRTDVYEAHISPQYDEVTQVFTAMVWLTKNGQIINNPTSCQIWLKDTSNTTQFNATSVSPNADGVFIIQQSSVALATEMNFECLIQVTDSTGLTWTSCDGAITFN